MRKPSTVLPRVLHEDDAIIAFDKPPGLLVAPDRWDKDAECLMDLVHRQLSPEIANVHRLDRGTSGVFLCARTKDSLRALAVQFESGGVCKEYLALARGALADRCGEVDAPLAPDPRRPGRMCVRSDGKPAQTAFEVLEAYRGYALVRAAPRTGRTHQVRVHLAHLGCPVVADELYGDGRALLLSELKSDYKRTRRPETPLIARLALHAAALTFTHPATGLDITVRSPLPKDFDIALKYLRRYAARKC